jgi:hypothetical protein
MEFDYWALDHAHDERRDTLRRIEAGLEESNPYNVSEAIEDLVDVMIRIRELEKLRDEE